LLITVVVIGVLTTASLVLFQGPQRKSHQAALQNDLTNYATAQELRLTSHGLYATAPHWLSEFHLSKGVQVLGSGGDHRGHWLLALGHEKGRAVCALAGGTRANPNLARTPVCGEGGTLTFVVSNDTPEVYESVTFDATGSLGELGLTPADVELVLWDFGDGSSAAGPASTHLKRTQAFAVPGREFETSLTAIAKSGGVHSGNRPLRTQGAPASPDGNLVLNGSGEMRNATNFPLYTFVPVPVGSAPGFFRYRGASVGGTVSEAIPIDSSRTYGLSFDARATQEVPTQLLMAVMAYDEDGHQFPYGHHHRIADSRLAEPLTPGDTVVYLNGVAGWMDGGTSTAGHRTLAIWGYRSGRGTEFGEYTYTRRVWSNAWQPFALDRAKNTIPLSGPLPASMGNPDAPGGAWPAGTALSNTNQTDSRNYCSGWLAIPSAWAARSCTYRGIRTSRYAEQGSSRRVRRACALTCS
jgi:type II secretory pathway pseudopilin PulG